MSGVGVSEHHHGEILQGAVRRGAESMPCLVTMPTRRVGSRAWYVPMAGDSGRDRGDESVSAPTGRCALEVVPAWKLKAARAARLALEFVGAPVSGRLEIECSVATGVGLGSSTCDVVAAIRAVCAAYGVAVAPDGSNINPVALTLLNQKLPNGGYVAPSPRTVVNGEGQYAFSIPCTYSENQFLTNFDWLQSARSRFGVKYFFSDSTILQSLIWSNVPGSPVNGTQNYRNIAATHDFIFSSTMLNQVQFGYHSIVRGFPSPSAFTFPGIGASVDPPSENFAYIELPQENIGAFWHIQKLLSHGRR